MKGFKVKQAKIRGEQTLKTLVRYVSLLLFQTDGIPQTEQSLSNRKLGLYYWGVRGQSSRLREELQSQEETQKRKKKMH